MSDEVLEGKEITDVRTGEQVVVRQGAVPSGAGLIVYVDMNKVGTLEFSKETIAVLEEELNPEEVHIRPDGFVYLPWWWYAKKLNRAFGFGKWGMLPSKDPVVMSVGNNKLIVWLHWLIVNGVAIAQSGGEMTYNPDNFSMSYGDALEGAKSNSLARCCKMLGMTLQLWDIEWVDEWKRQYAETYDNPNKNAKQKKLWRKKGSKGSATASTTPLDDTPRGQNSTQPAETGETTSQTPETPPEGFTTTELKDATKVAQIKALLKVKESKATIAKIMQVINSLDKSKRYSVTHVVETVMEGETNE